MAEKKETETTPPKPEKTYLINFEEKPQYAGLAFIGNQYLPITAGISLGASLFGFEGMMVTIEIDETGIYYVVES